MTWGATVLSEGEARKIIGSEGAGTLVGIIEGAWQDHIREGRRRTPRARANVVWDYMIDRADENLLGMEGVRRVKLWGSTGYVLQERMLLRFKKHNLDYNAQNYPTLTQSHLSLLGHFPGMPQLDHVTCGYVLDKVEAEIAEIVVVRHVKNKIEWIIDLRELAGGELTPVRPILPSLPGSGAEDIAALPSIARVTREEDGDGR